MSLCQANIHKNMEDFTSGKADIKKEYLDYAGIEKKNDLGIQDRLPFDQSGTTRDSWSYAANGMPVRNGNKTHNNMSKFGLNQMGQEIRDSGYQQDEQGRWYRSRDIHGNEVKEYIKDSADRPSSFYYGETKTDPNTVKRGTSRLGVNAKYTPNGEGYGRESGPAGIDIDNPNTREVFNDRAKIDAYEALVNANPHVLRARKYFDDGSNMAAVQEEMYGSGKSEYVDKEATRFFDDINAIPENERFLTKEDKAQLKAMREIKSNVEHTLIANEVHNSLDGYTKEGLKAINKAQWEADKAGWTGKRISQMNDEEFTDYQRMRNRDQLEQGYYADDGFLMSTAMKIGKQGIRAFGALLDVGANILASSMERVDKISRRKVSKKDKAYLNKVRDFWMGGENSVFPSEETIDRALRIDRVQSAKVHS